MSNEIRNANIQPPVDMSSEEASSSSSGKENTSSDTSLHLPTKLTTWQKITRNLLITLAIQAGLFGINWVWENVVTSRMKPNRADRYRTLGSVVYSVVSTGVWVTFVMNTLSKFGVSLKPMLAAAGVLGIALGFGAQTLIKDFMSGVFILLENQMNVGDVVTINDQTGTVDHITLRYIHLITTQGSAVYISNGTIDTVVNYSQHDNMAQIDVLLPFPLLKENKDSNMPCQVETHLAYALANALKVDHDKGGLKDVVIAHSKPTEEGKPVFLGGCLYVQPQDRNYEMLRTLSGKIFFNGVTKIDAQGTTLQINAYCKPGLKWRAEYTIKDIVRHLVEDGALSAPLQRMENLVLNERSN